MYSNNHSRRFSQVLTLIFTALLLTLACSFANPFTLLPDPTETPTSGPIATVTLSGIAGSNSDGSIQIYFDPGSLAAGMKIETVAAVSSDSDVPYWEILPEYTVVTLQGYPITDHHFTSQIFIFPVEELKAANEGAARIVTSLETLIRQPQELPDMPFLPINNMSQVFHVHLQYLDFQNGQGLRYLVEFAQGILPISNYDLVYTYQGLTSDGQYYVAAIFPVNHPSLPTDAAVTGNEPPEFTNDFPSYVADIVESLNPQSANTFTPDLTLLDAMMASLEIK